MLAWGELATAAEQVPRPAMMELRNLAVTKHAKNGFTLKWLKQTAACALPAVEAEELRANIAGRERCKTLSLRAGGAAARDYGAGPATLVSLATLGAFLPAAEAKKFSHEDVWEADLVPGAGRLLALHRLRHLLSQDLRLATNTTKLASGRATAWRLLCGITRPRWTRGSLPSASTKCCVLPWRFGRATRYSRERMRSTRSEPASGLCALSWRTTKRTLDRLALAPRATPCNEAPLTYSGSAKPLLCLRAAASLPGCPCIYLSDANLDDAGQITAGEGLPVQYAELLLRVTAKDPVQECNEAERGVRIIFECADATQPDIRADLMWVVSVRDSLAIARQRPDTLLRVVAKPHVLFDTDGEPSLRHWQVIFQFPAADGDIEPFARRRAWQLSLDSQPSLEIKRL